MAQRKCCSCGKFISEHINESGQKRTEQVIFYEKCPRCGVLQ